LNPQRGHWAERWEAKRREVDVVAAAVIENGSRPASADSQLFDMRRDEGVLLRGIPAVGRGVTGAIPGSTPGERLSS
jgi:hypothetical protein